MPQILPDRRQFLTAAAAALAGIASRTTRAAEDADRQLAPVRTITRGPKHHWFGYYDKLQFDPSQRYVLGMQVAFEHRSPRAGDAIQIGMVDLADNDRWIELGTSRAWCWQQGCMLQWIPGSKSRVLWNDREEDRYVCRVLDVQTGKTRTLPQPVYALAPDGRTAISTDFRRINDVRPGYGYAGLPDPFAGDLAPRDSGISTVDLETGDSRLIISLAQVASMGRIPRADPAIKHYFNHLLFNPDGSRFVFLHRWRYPDGKRLSRMITADPDGSDIRILDDNGLTSHFIWRDCRSLLAWSGRSASGNALCLIEDRADGESTIVGSGVLTWDGHVSILPGGEWILTDTYPDAQRNQTVYLFHIPTRKLLTLGRFHSPAAYTGEWRCDTHPRHSPDGRLAVIDSPHTKAGRQMHLLELSTIVSAASW